MNKSFTTTLASLSSSSSLGHFLDTLSDYLASVSTGNLDTVLHAGTAVAPEIAWLLGPIDTAVESLQSGDAATWAKVLALTEHDEPRYSRLRSLSQKCGGTWREFVTVVSVAPHDGPPAIGRMLFGTLQTILKNRTFNRPEGAYALIMGHDDLRIIGIVELSKVP